MTDPARHSVAAIRARQEALVKQRGELAEADRILAETLVGAHAAMRESVRRLDAISAEIDRAVTDQTALALDTSLGARELQRFLATKQGEMAAVVAAARDLDRTKSAELQRLRDAYGHAAI